jgi:hypothetical protein
MKDFIIKELTECEAVFFNKTQSIVGTIKATSFPKENFIELDKESESLTEKQEEDLRKYFFETYHSK